MVTAGHHQSLEPLIVTGNRCSNGQQGEQDMHSVTLPERRGSSSGLTIQNFEVLSTTNRRFSTRGFPE